jgi:hypothetical protein
MGRTVSDRPASSTVEEIEITPEMIEAGTAEILGFLGGDDPRLGTGELAILVFRAMFLARGKEPSPSASRNLSVQSRCHDTIEIRRVGFSGRR